MNGLILCSFSFSREILEELAMSEEVTVAQARKKWTQLVRRYLELKVYFRLMIIMLCMTLSSNCISYIVSNLLLPNTFSLFACMC